MAQNSDSQIDDPEIKHLREKAAKGAANLVGDVLNNPEVQKTIKNALVRETVKNAIIMSCLFIGILKIYDVSKQLLGFGWQVELVISIMLILVGLIYTLKNLVNGK